MDRGSRQGIFGCGRVQTAAHSKPMAHRCAMREAHFVPGSRDENAWQNPLTVRNLGVESVSSMKNPPSGAASIALIALALCARRDRLARPCRCACIAAPGRTGRPRSPTSRKATAPARKVSEHIDPAPPPARKLAERRMSPGTAAGRRRSECARRIQVRAAHRASRTSSAVISARAAWSRNRPWRGTRRKQRADPPKSAAARYTKSRAPTASPSTPTSGRPRRFLPAAVHLYRDLLRLQRAFGDRLRHDRAQPRLPIATKSPPRRPSSVSIQRCCAR